MAALVNGEVTLKSFYRAEGGNVVLQPANRRMYPIVVNEAGLEIQGVMAGLYRRIN